MLGLSVLPRPSALGAVTDDVLQTHMQHANIVQQKYCNNVQALQASNVSKQAVQASVPRVDALALADALDKYSLTLRATYMPPAPTASPVCAEITSAALRQAANSANAVNVPHPLNVGAFDLQCAGKFVSLLQYTV
jgi:hypothetical protein